MNPSKNPLIAAIIAILIIAGGVAVYYAVLKGGGSSPTNFAQCAAAGNPIMESYPRQCRTPDGHTFVEQVAPAPKPPAQKPTTGAGCMLGGCGGQVCQDAGEEPVITTCIYRAEFACYKTAKCERQTDGTCGWTQTPELKTCLQNPPPLE